VASPSRFSFVARRVPVDLPPSVPILGFEDGAEGEPRTYLSFMYEAGDGVVRAWWGHDQEGADEVIVRLVEPRLSRERFETRVALAEAASPAVWPFDAVDVALSLDDAELDAAGEALALLMAPKRSEAVVGPPILGAQAAGSWKGGVGPLELAVVVSNRGGRLDGVVLELGGAAIERELLRVEAIGSGAGAGVRDGATWRLRLSLPAHVVEEPPRPPPAALVRLTGEATRPGSELLTVRVIPAGAVDRAGASLVGRPVTIG
jgi:hypothetical protein